MKNQMSNLTTINTMEENADIKLLRKMEKGEEPNKIDLFDYQKKHAEKLIDVLMNNNAALDASDPGTGKTYIASYVCAKLNIRPIVICPKSVVSRWISVLEQFGVNFVMVTNYELITRGKYYYKGTKMVCPYIKQNGKKKYEWKVDSDMIFIYDEVHKCKFFDTLNAKTLLAAKDTKAKILMLSATIMEKPSEFAMYAYILNFSNDMQVLMKWIRKLSTPAKTIHSLLFDKLNPKAARLSIAELGDKFPKTQITAETYTMKGSIGIAKEYEKIQEKIKAMKETGSNSNFILTKLQNEFRQIELFKIPTFIELTLDHLENNFSVVIFVNYTDTLELLLSNLKEHKIATSTIHGGQSAKERDENIDLFQTDQTRVMVANIKAGGVGVSLHDITGKHQRISLISPTYSATSLIQVLGRVHRTGAKSKSLQRIIFAANTPEENISKMLYKKLSNLSLLNDGDLEGYYIDGLVKDEEYDKSLTGQNKDLSIIIDEQLEQLKHKRMVRVDKIADLFPKVIDKISGTSAIYLIKGIKIFEGINILLLGEHHDRNNGCKKCGENCVDMMNLMTYITYNLRPNILDAYLEIPYTPSDKTMFALVGTKGLVLNGDESRLGHIFNQFKYLLLHNTQTTINMRLHIVDVRRDISLTPNEHHNAQILLDMFTDLMLYRSSDMSRMTQEQIDTVAENLRLIQGMLEDEKVLAAVRGLLTYTNDKLLQIVKINKQKEQLIKSYETIDSERIHKAIDRIQQTVKESFSIGEKEYEYLLKVRKLFKHNTYRDSNNYLYFFLKKMEDRGYDNRDDDSPLLNLVVLHSVYMDAYAVYRMLRIFDDKKQANCMFYGGEAHTKNIRKLLLSTKYFKLIARRNQSDMPDDCSVIENV